MSRGRGFLYENIACHYLLDQKLKLVTRNYDCSYGELDLIMLDQDTLVFIEVRYRKNITYGLPIETITKSKQNKIIKTSECFLLANTCYSHIQFRYDVIGIINGFKNDQKNIRISDNCLNISWYKNVITN